MSATLQFLPWVRLGLASLLPAGPPAGAAFPVTLTVRGEGDPARQDEVSADLALHGPGDVLGLDPRQVLRTEPRADSTGYEPDYLAAVEFRRPDLPWLFTPTGAAPGESLVPWLCLVVVPADGGASLRAEPHQPLPGLEVPAGELPDLREAGFWAHVQVVWDPEADGPLDEATLRSALATRPHRACSRLLCPRRLAPDTRYRACLVPTFEAGRKAGLGLAPDPADGLRPAWTPAPGGPVELPVYFSWEFATGRAGDFESLVARLRPRALPEEVGTRPLDVSDPGLGLAVVPGARLSLDSALRAPGRQPAPWSEPDRRRQLARLLDGAATTALAPPLYGRWQTGRARASADGAPGDWVDELNLDPRRRVAAGLGAEVVRRHQETLVRAAWQQLGEIQEANRLLRQAQLAREVSRSLVDRVLGPLGAAELLQVTAPVHGRVRLGAATVRQGLRDSRLPVAATRAAFRRLVARRSPVMQRLARVRAAPAPAPGEVLRDLDTGRVDLDGALRRARPAASRVVGDVPGPDRPRPLLVEDSPAGARFREAAVRLVERALAAQPGVDPPRRAALGLDAAAAAVRARLAPDRTIAARVRARLVLPPDALPAADPLEPLRATPRFPVPMSGALGELSPHHLVAGLARIPTDSVTVLETNPGFIEAYLVGLNHEMARELLWRGYPTDGRATFFQSFWGEGGDEIPPVHAWAPGSSLGAHLRGADAHVVVLVRGELVRRYPGISLTAVRAEWAAGGNLAAIRQAGGTVVGDRYRRPVPPGRRTDADVRTAAFSGLVADDTAFAGFALRVADARGAVDARGEPDPGGAAGWFVILRQAPAEPRFGFDEAAGEPGPIPAESARLTWAHVTRPGDGPHVVVKSPALDGRRFDGNRARWGASSAHMAYLCLQSPVLVAVHAGALLLAPS